jgi:hypothetical protein
MKLAAMIAMTALMVGSAQGKQETKREVTVYLNDRAAVPAGVQTEAQNLASSIFGSIGVKIHWRAGKPAATDTDAIVIDLVTNTPAAEKPGALAFARPYEGVYIRIFWDRIAKNDAAGKLLGYVIVHEITHILQGVARHSSEGIMNARWTFQEECQMKWGKLRFTPADVELIYSGMEVRSDHGTKPAGLSTETAAVGME